MTLAAGGLNQEHQQRIATTYAALAALTGYRGERVPVTGLGTNGHVFWWNGTKWVPEGGQVVTAQGATITSHIAPAATFTSVSVANNGGNVQLNSAGVHGLTTSPAAGKSIYISAGTGWTVGRYTILTVDDTDSITLNHAYDAGLGSPTIALANTEVTIATLATIPGGLMGETGSVSWELIESYTASTNNKFFRVKLVSTAMASLTRNTGTATTDYLQGRIWNRNSASAQVSVSASGPGGALTSAPTTGTVDTSADAALILTYQPVSANEYGQIEAYTITVKP